MSTLAAHLIDQSIRHTEIIHEPWTAELAAALESEADDSVRCGSVHEYWGRRLDRLGLPGGEWRVHLDVAEVQP